MAVLKGDEELWKGDVGTLGSITHHKASALMLQAYN